MIHSSPVRKKKSLIWILNFVCVFVSVSTILFAEEKKYPQTFRMLARFAYFDCWYASFQMKTQTQMYLELESLLMSSCRPAYLQLQEVTV